MKFDHGISLEDIEAFQARLIGEALENAYIWSCMREGSLKDELREDVLEKLLACYQLSMWTEKAFPEPEPEHEPIEED